MISNHTDQPRETEVDFRGLPPNQDYDVVTKRIDRNNSSDGKGLQKGRIQRLRSNPNGSLRISLAMQEYSAAQVSLSPAN